MGWSIETISRSLAETHAIGRALGGVLVPGDVVGLVGGLGAGKTNLVKGIAVGLGASDERVVNSPTFVLVNEYQGRVHMCHLDVYRLGSAAELLDLGFDEMCEGQNVVLVEWADRVAEAFGEGALWIELEILGENERRITLRGHARSVEERVCGVVRERIIAM